MKQSMKLAARILENLPVMSPDVMQKWIDNPKALRGFLAGLVPTDKNQAAAIAGNDTTHLRFLESASLASTSGSTTLAQAGDVFIGFLDPRFKNWGTDIAGVDAEETLVDIYEMKKNGSFADIFGSFGVDLRSLVFTQGQVKEFPRTHRHLLRQDGYATFFLFEVEIDGKSVLFVASVHVDGGRLEARVFRFPFGAVWHADYRHWVVVPQLAV